MTTLAMTLPHREWSSLANYAGRFLRVVVIAGLCACSNGDNAPAADNLKAIDTLKALDPSLVGTAALQSPAPPSPAGKSDMTPPGRLPPTGGETYKRGGTMAPQDSARRQDPPPNLTGETRKIGGTMAPERRARDSVYGPKMMIDSKGNVTPIKK